MLGGNKSIDHEQLRKINIELKQILEQIDLNETQKQTQNESNLYEQKYRLGNKLTYGTPFQLRHMFTGQYLSLNPQEMSQEYGCCELHLSETKDESVFIIEPANGKNNMVGLTVDYADFFCIRNKSQSSPFYIHIFKKFGDTNFDKQDK